MFCGPLTSLAQVLWSSYKLGKGHLQTSGHEVRLQAWLCSELKRNQGQVRLQASVRAAYRLDHLQTYEACKRTHTKLVNGKLVIGQPKLVTGPCAMTKLVTGQKVSHSQPTPTNVMKSTQAPHVAVRYL